MCNKTFTVNAVMRMENKTDEKKKIRILHEPGKEIIKLFIFVNTIKKTDASPRL